MSSANPAPLFILKVACPDRMGIVAAVSRFLLDQACDIVDSAQFGDRSQGKFFLRIAFIATRATPLEALEAAFAPIAAAFAMDASFHDAGKKSRTLILVSRFGHCLNDLLYRWRIGALPIDIVAVASNHPEFEETARASGTRFHHFPVNAQTKAAQEAAILALVEADRIDLVVLARYMQVLSPQFCNALSGRLINIHHSFLPSFRGARPYQQAHERGVKLIGATAHYVTPQLDEGPIIEQAIERVHHGMSAEDFVAVGRDVENVVLARAIKWHAEHRIIVNGNRTVVFN